MADPASSSDSVLPPSGATPDAALDSSCAAATKKAMLVARKRRKGCLFSCRQQGLAGHWVWLTVAGQDFVFHLGVHEEEARRLVPQATQRAGSAANAREVQEWINGQIGASAQPPVGPIVTIEEFYAQKAALDWLGRLYAQAPKPQCTAVRRRGIGRRATVFKPKNAQGQKTAFFGSRIAVSVGKRPWFAFHRDEARAQAISDEFHRRFRAGEDLTKLHVWRIRQMEGPASGPWVTGPVVMPKAAFADGERHSATIRQILELRLAMFFPNSSRRTLTQCEQALLNAIETVACFRAEEDRPARKSHTFTLEHFEDYLELDCSILKDPFIDSYCTARYEAGIAPESIRSEVKAMQRFLSAEVRAACGETLDVSGAQDFWLHPPYKLGKRQPLPPLPDDEVTGIYTRLHAFTGSKPVALALLLALYAGLRRNELRHAHTDWLVGLSGHTIKVTRGRDFIPKNENALRSIEIPRWLFQLLKTLPPGYLLGSEDEAQRNRVLDEAVAWLQVNGLGEVERPLHRLRAYYAGFLLRHFENELEKVLHPLGHHDLEVTFRHYSRRALPRAVAARRDIVPLGLIRHLS